MAIRKNRDPGFVDMMVGGGRRTAAPGAMATALSGYVVPAHEYNTIAPKTWLWHPSVALIDAGAFDVVSANTLAALSNNSTQLVVNCKDMCKNS